MKRHILTAAMLIVGSAAFAFDYQSNVGSFVASAVSTSNFDQFSWNWVGFNDQKIAVTSDIQVTKGGFRIVRQRDGAVMYEASEGTNSINSVVTTTNASTNYYLSLSIPRTNLPPNGTYLASFLAYEVTYTSVPTRVIADGKITIKYSPWEETNQSSYINPLAYTIIGPPGHTLTDATNWPFALTGTLDTVTGSIWTSLGTLSNKHDGLTSTYAVATGGLWTSLGTHTAQISALITTSATLTARAGSNEASIANLITTSGTHTVQIGTISNLAVVAQAYANTNLANIAVLQTGAATYVALGVQSNRINVLDTDVVHRASGGSFLAPVTGTDFTASGTITATNIVAPGSPSEFVGGESLTLTAGIGGSSEGAGGSVTIAGGSAKTTGGNVSLTGGEGTASGHGGDASVAGGVAAMGAGGDASLTAGKSSVSTGGSAFVTAGLGSTGGTVRITAGRSEIFRGGEIVLTAAYSEDDSGGGISLTAGDSGGSWTGDPPAAIAANITMNPGVVPTMGTGQVIITRGDLALSLGQLLGTATNSLALGGVLAAGYATTGMLASVSNEVDVLQTGTPTLVQYEAWSNTVQTGDVRLADFLAYSNTIATGSYTQAETDAAILQSETGGWRYATIPLVMRDDQDMYIAPSAGVVTTNILATAWCGAGGFAHNLFHMHSTADVLSLRWRSSFTTNHMEVVVAGLSTSSSPLLADGNYRVLTMADPWPSGVVMNVRMYGDSTNGVALWAAPMLEYRYKP